MVYCQISVCVLLIFSSCYGNIIDGIKDKVVQTVDAAKSAVSRARPGRDIKSDNKTVCFGELGCFSTEPPWYSLLRPFPMPASPEEIDVKLYLYTRKNPEERYTVTLWPNISLQGSDFNLDRPYTAFITHGFASNGNSSWLNDLKNAYLQRRDANVFLVDWGNGASTANYLQVGSNTRVAGAELARFGEYLVNELGQNASRIHLMGHSLGAHISAYMAQAIPRIGQLTAFDPAQPGFEGCPEEVRLSKDDALYVDVIHTNTRPIIPLLGFGYILPVGDVDYYMNGGLIQPGCILPPVDDVNITSIADLANFPVEVISGWVACSHGRSYEYYIEALLNDYCRFWGRYAGVLGTALDVSTIGKAELVLEKLSSCTLEKCSPIGLDSRHYPARGGFNVLTHAYSPFCQNDPEVTKKMEELRSTGLQKNGTFRCDSISPVVDIKDKVVGKLI